MSNILASHIHLFNESFLLSLIFRNIAQAILHQFNVNHHYLQTRLNSISSAAQQPSPRGNAAVPPSRYFPRFNPVQPGSPRSRVCRFVPVLSPVRKHIFAVPSSRFTTVFPGRHTSTPGLINQDHPGGHPVDTRFIPVDTRFIPVNIRWTHGSSRSTHGSLRFLRVHYGALRFITVHPGHHTVNYGSLRCLTVHYGNSDHPGQHQVHYGS